MAVLLDRFEITSLPSDLKAADFVGALSGAPFVLENDLRSGKTYLLFEDGSLCERIRRALPGFEYSPAPVSSGVHQCTLMSPFAFDDKVPAFDDIHRVMGTANCRIYIFFVRSDISRVGAIKERIEEALSRKEVRATTSSSGRSSYSSVHSDLYYGSDERAALLRIIASLSELIGSNGGAYNISIALESEDEQVAAYVRSRVAVFEERRARADGIGRIYSSLKSLDTIPSSYRLASLFLAFSNRIRRISPVRISAVAPRNSGITLGTMLNSGIQESDESLTIERSSLNLGTVITGLPGVGKTIATMALAAQIGKESASIIVLSPTREWSEFASQNSFRSLDIYNSRIPINFFKCYNEESKGKFVENLSMMLANASAAGPYRNSLEKCLLAALRRCYGKTLCPDPVLLYEEIEESIIEQHGKRTNAGVRYTKHGENVRAALENLRLMLFRPEFSSADGIDLHEVFRSKVVFDLSSVGNNMKQFFYSLILNQLYGFTEGFDEKGNDELRMLIIMEEAQLIFGQEEASAVTIDLKQRIQDFRKKGIGLILIAHSITDINQSLRRLCQTRLYFRQSPDLIKYAVTDLGIGEEEMEGTVSRMRSLSMGECIAQCIDSGREGKVCCGPFFIKSPRYELMMPLGTDGKKEAFDGNYFCDCILKILDERDSPAGDVKGRVEYLGERVSEFTSNERGEARINGLMRGRRYIIRIKHGKSKVQIHPLIAEGNVIIKMVDA
ncbi:MAG: hypothetical protein KGH59_01330 [Candidatus Micrarchaeota archaeon]|nr:hypothetical protein [Candidatus Micrarchaeota archaeon]MDE1804408.1 hypothetical protein [Candidatus Micrarchaeota archaeon]MDE1846924.1 hypothetical protein [Candidatus Micrarchaeota archaeon]